MIKNAIKNQIRKTGMVKELEIANENLKKQLINVKNANKNLKNQLNSEKNNNENLKNQLINEKNDKENLKNQLINLKKDNTKLMIEKSEIIGFSLRKNTRGISSDEGKPAILKYILENVEKDAKILDVGFGAGVYGKLLRALYYQNIDGIDVYGENIKEMGLDKIYDNIFIENILDFNFDYYDLIIMGDVLEHIELESAKKLLSGIVHKNKCGHIIVSIPYEYEQDEAYGNKYEKHLQPDVTKEYMEKHYPYLKLIDESIMAHCGLIMATYTWNKE